MPSMDGLPMRWKANVQERTSVQERVSAQEQVSAREQANAQERTSAQEQTGARRSALQRAIAAAGICLLLTATFFIVSSSDTWAVYTDSMRSRDDAKTAGYAMSLDIPQTEAAVVQSDTWDYEKLISVRNCSDTALAYNIVVSAEGAKTWPDGMTAVLLTASGEKADGIISDNTCTFSDESWRLEPGVQMQDVYGLRLSTTYDTSPGDYSFSISSFTYQPE